MRSSQRGEDTLDLREFRWFNLVVCLTVDNTLLYDRLKNRNYSQNKIQENVECEIMQVVLEEAKESYKSDILVVLTSNSLEEMESNVERIEEWVSNYVEGNISV